MAYGRRPKTKANIFADAINRYRNETLRVYGVLEIHLSGKYTGEPKEYLAGKGKGKYSFADIKVSIGSATSDAHQH
jgi:hypothetical protein